jgi:hypothetical protein
MNHHGLEAELATAGKATTLDHFRALERLGVSRNTLCDLWARNYGFGVMAASDAGDGTYYPGDGQPHLLLPVYEDGELVDLCAFRSANPSAWLLRSGMGWALGLEHGLEPHTWGDPVRLSLSPLEWLQNDAAGLCVLDWDAPEVRYLVGVPHLVCSDAGHASTLRRTLSTPVRFPTISVMEARLAA